MAAETPALANVRPALRLATAILAYSFGGLKRDEGTEALPPGDYLFRVMSYTDKTQDGKPLISQNGKTLKTYDYSADTVGAWAADEDQVINGEVCNADRCTCEH
jgi:hypothetical protein